MKVLLALISAVLVVRLRPCPRSLARSLGRMASEALRRALHTQELRESEERLRQIADNIREVIWIANPELTERYYINPAYERIWGRSTESAIEDPRSVFDAVHPDDRERVNTALEGYARGDYDVEYRIVRPDGEARWIWSRTVPVRDEHGDVYRVVGIAEDITRRKSVAAEREWLLEREREAREQVTTILESIGDAFYAVDGEWRFTYLNERAREVMRAMLRREPGRLIGQVLWDAVPDLLGTRFEAEYRRAMAGQVSTHFEANLKPWDRWLEVDGYPSGEGLSVYFRDVTDRKRGEEEREKLLERERAARTEAERAIRTRDEVMSIVAHDLRNPLNTISASAALLLEVALAEEKQAEQLRIIRRSTERMNRLIQDLLDVTRIEAGRFTVQPRALPAASILDEACRLHATQAREKRLQLHCEAADALPSICADRDRILQIFSNLIGNAFKSTPEGVRLTVRAEPEGDEVRFAVSDTGPGIPPENLPHLFERFWQERREGQLGAGLGLPIARGIVVAHGGRIWAESEMGRGSTFYFTLPVLEDEGECQSAESS